MAPVENLTALAHEFLSRLCTLDIDAMLALRTPTCTHSIGPSSMNRPSMSNEAFRAAYAPMLHHFRTMSADIKALFTDPAANVVILHTETRADTVGGAYDNEYVYFLHADPEGAKLERIEEFVDSARAQEQGARLREAIARK